jgi:hypothetical protein
LLSALVYIPLLFSGAQRKAKKNTSPQRAQRLVYLCQELFLMFSREAGKNIFNIALVTENVTLSNPGL